MRRRVITGIALISLLAPVAAAALATLSVTPQDLSFQARCVRSGATAQTVTVQNTGDQDAVEVAIAISPSPAATIFPLGGTTARPTLAPGEEMSFQVGFRPEIAGEASARARITYRSVVPPSPTPSPTGTQSPGSPSPSPSPTETPSPTTTPLATAVPLTGSGIDRWVDTSPHFLNFGAHRVGRRASAQRITIFDDGRTSLRVSSISLAGRNAGDFSISETGPVTVTDGRPFSLEVGFRPGAVGARAADLVIESNSCDGSPLRVPLAGIGVQPDIITQPLQIDFGSVRLERTPREFLTVANQGGLTLTVEEMELDGSNADLFELRQLPRFPVDLEPGESFEVRILFRPEEPGPVEAAVLITSNDPDDGIFEIPVIATVAEPPPSPTPSPTEIEAPPAPPADTGSGFSFPVGEYLSEIAIAAAVTAFFLLLILVRRLRGFPE